jgi:hypothetical protein
MSVENRLTPPQDPGAESESIYFDYGLILATGEALMSVTGVTCVVDAGTDPTPSSRLSGGNALVPSPKTGQVNGAVKTTFSGQLVGTTYKLQCIAVTTLGQTLSIITYI